MYLSKPLAKKIRQTLDIGLGWQRLLSLIDSRFFASLYWWLFVLPILANIFGKLPHSVTLLPNFFDAPILLNLTLPFSWYCLYFSAVFLVASRLLYVLFCPHFLRSYSNAGDAIEKGVTSQYIANEARTFLKAYFRKLTTLTDKEYSNLNDLLSQYRAEPLRVTIAKILQLPIGDEVADSLERIEFKEDASMSGYYRLDSSEGPTYIEKSQFFKHQFWDLFEFQNFSYPMVRLICTSLFICGMVLFTFVALTSLNYVAASFINS